ncbi:MAG: hypothetical protein HY965_05140 [Ignavibacteriales bacterium]|nr:hypothetical protein [Ignavibacteriales bacterium]
MLGLKEQIIIRKSISRILPVANAAVFIFFSKLYEMDPDLKCMMKISDEAGERKYFGILVFLINRMDSIDSGFPLLEELAANCILQGMKEKHFVVLGQAFYWTLAQTLRSAFTEEVKNAWKNFILEICNCFYPGLHIDWEGKGLGNDTFETVQRSGVPFGFKTANS